MKIISRWKNSLVQMKGYKMKVIMVGNGGHSKVIQDIITCLKNHDVIAILDDLYEEINERKGVIYGPIAHLNQLIKQDVKVVIAIGNNEIRKRLFQKLPLHRDQYLTVVHPSAVVSPTAIIGYGTVVMPSALINAESVIGDHCIINTGAIVEHENTIENYSHISPNATLTGNVSIGEGAHVGASATIIPGINIGKWSVIGAGSTVIRPIPDHRKAVGSPARLLTKEKGIGKFGDRVVM